LHAGFLGRRHLVTSVVHPTQSALEMNVNLKRQSFRSPDINHHL